MFDKKKLKTINRVSKYFGLALLTSYVIGCSSNPHQAEKIETQLEKPQEMSDGQMGLNEKDEMVFRRKIKVAQYLADLQKDVYELETQIYGDSALGRAGQYGALRNCRDDVRSKYMKGDGKISPMPKKLVLTAKEDMSLSDILNKTREGKIGVDEKKEIVAISDDYITNRIKRFEGYKQSYLKQKELFEEDLRICNASMKEKKFDIEVESTIKAPNTNGMKESTTDKANESGKSEEVKQ